jgi:hypothetical protein
MNKLAKNSLVVMLLLLPGFLIAQQDSIPKQATLKRGFCEDVPFIIGDFSPLNEILIQNGFPALEPTYLGFAFGVSARPSNKDSYFTAKIFMLKTNSQYDFNNDSKNASIRFLGLQEDFHLDLVRSKKWRIGPDFGFGFGIQRLKLYEKVYTPPDFASALSPSVITHQEKKFNSAFFFLNAGIGIDRKFKFKEVDFYFGMGAGYRLSTPAGFSVKYQYDVSSPRARLSGFQYDFKLRFEIRELVPSKKSLLEYRKFQ